MPGRFFLRNLMWKALNFFYLIFFVRNNMYIIDVICAVIVPNERLA